MRKPVEFWKIADGLRQRRVTARPVDYGSYTPEKRVTAGLVRPGDLNELNSPATNTFTLVDGETYIDKIIYGDIRPPSVHNNNIDLINCLTPGGLHIPSTNSGVINCDNSRSGNGKVRLWDCEIDPRVPSLNRDCIRGHKWEMYRTWMQQGVDGMGIFVQPTTNGGRCDVVAMGNIVENLMYAYPDYDNGVNGVTEHSDGTHSDCIQYQGGKNVSVKGNLLMGTATAIPSSDPNPTKPWLLEGDPRWTSGSLIVIQDNTGAGINTTVVFEENFLYGAPTQVNIKSGANFVFRNNKHYRLVATHSTSPLWSGYWTRFDYPAYPDLVVGLDTNTWIDGPYAGQVLTSPRDRGINYNTA